MRMDAASKNEYFLQLLTALFEFMRRSGFSTNRISEITTAALKANAPHDASFASATDLVAASNVLDRWRTSRSYIDQFAQPRAVRLVGRAPSVEALVRAERRAHKATLQASQMSAFGLIRHVGGGLYRPSIPSGIVHGLDKATQHQMAHALFMLLETIAHNISTPDKSKRLIERCAEIPDLPSRHRSEFRAFAEQQGQIFVQTINRWLVSRRAATLKVKRRASVAGIHVYAYLGETSSKRKQGRLTRGGRLLR
jgi:hypothetical protein